LEETYNLKGLTPRYGWHQLNFPGWKRPII